MSTSARAFRSRGPQARSAATRARIVTAVRELLEEGAFHQSSAEQVAERAGVARATLYQHFRTRSDLVQGICDVVGENPALLAIRTTVELPDPEEALSATIGHAVRFWASEDAAMAELYGAAAVDEAARDFVVRQRADRRGEMERLAAHLRRAGRLRAGLTAPAATALLMVFTSYETFRELRESGQAERRAAATLQDAARAALLG